MAREIERKYLVINSSFKNLSKGVLYRQGYLSTDTRTTVRIRTVGEKAYITIKGADRGISRLEYEYSIPVKDANEMLNKLCKKPIIEKYRYEFEYEGHTWVVDEFKGENEGLIVAEIELESEEEEFVKPDFIGSEVTQDYRYRNSNLVDNPYKKWDSI